MAISIFFAKFLGLYMLILGLALLVRPNTLSLVVKDFVASRALVFLSGAFALVFGLVIVLLHNVWVFNWPVAITIIGYLAVIKGVMRLFFPEWVDPMAARFLDSPVMKAMIFLMILVGAYLVFQGFEAVVPFVGNPATPHEMMD